METNYIHIWDITGKALEPIKDNMFDIYYLRCDNDEARATVTNWFEEEWEEYPDWKESPSGVWKQMGDDELDPWMPLETVKAQALAEYERICEEIAKYS